jgi:hypothetical protein
MFLAQLSDYFSHWTLIMAICWGCPLVALIVSTIKRGCLTVTKLVPATFFYGVVAVVWITASDELWSVCAFYGSLIAGPIVATIIFALGSRGDR